MALRGGFEGPVRVGQYGQNYHNVFGQITWYCDDNIVLWQKYNFSYISF